MTPLTEAAQIWEDIALREGSESQKLYALPTIEEPVYLYKNPGDSILYTLKKGDEVTVLKTETGKDTWKMVSYYGIKGWVEGKYFTSRLPDTTIKKSPFSDTLLKHSWMIESAPIAIFRFLDKGNFTIAIVKDERLFITGSQIEKTDDTSIEDYNWKDFSYDPEDPYQEELPQAMEGIEWVELTGSWSYFERHNLINFLISDTHGLDGFSPEGSFPEWRNYFTVIEATDEGIRLSNISTEQELKLVPAIYPDSYFR